MSSSMYAIQGLELQYLLDFQHARNRIHQTSKEIQKKNSWGCQDLSRLVLLAYFCASQSIYLGPALAGSKTSLKSPAQAPWVAWVGRFGVLVSGSPLCSLLKAGTFNRNLPNTVEGVYRTPNQLSISTPIERLPRGNDPSDRPSSSVAVVLVLPSAWMTPRVSSPRSPSRPEGSDPTSPHDRLTFTPLMYHTSAVTRRGGVARPIQ